MSPVSPSFLFICTQQGSEKHVKEQVQSLVPSLHLAYSRPHLLTFKQTRLEDPITPFVQLPLVLAQNYGLSLFRCPRGQLAQQVRSALPPLQALYQEMGSNQGKRSRVNRLHIWRREAFARPLDLNLEPDLQEALRLLGDNLQAPPPTWQEGDLVWDFLQVEEDEIWVGLHEHTPDRALFPAPFPTLPVPPEAPSRAYGKMSESLWWSQMPIRPGDWAWELGAAPGGMSYCLLQKGINVLAVDTGKMDPICATLYDPQSGQGQFYHDNRPVQKLLQEGLPRQLQNRIPSPHWLILDLNLHPRVSLSFLQRMRERFGQQLLGGLFTFKMNDPSLIKEVPRFLGKLQKWHPALIRSTQLPSNRKEITVYLLTSKGKGRQGK